MEYSRIKKEPEEGEEDESGEEELLKEAIADEEDGLELYEELIASCDDPGTRKIYEEILADEKRHIELLNKIEKS